MPDVCASWTFGKLPVVAEQQIKITHIPFDRVGGPRSFYATCGGVNANATFKLIFPAEALLGDAGSFGFSPHKLWITRPMGFAECMATSH